MKSFTWTACIATAMLTSCGLAQMFATDAVFGGNAIRLYAEPLAYEVLSGGKTLVPRTEISLTLDGADIASSAKFVSAKKRKLEGVAKSPVYKKASVGMAGSETLADFGEFAVRLIARVDGVAYRFELKKGGTWYAAGITNAEARDYTLDTSFLGGGSWKMEIFRDAEDADRNASNFVHEKRVVKAGDKMTLRLAQGGGFTAHFTK